MFLQTRLHTARVGKTYAQLVVLAACRLFCATSRGCRLIESQ